MYKIFDEKYLTKLEKIKNKNKISKIKELMEKKISKFKELMKFEKEEEKKIRDNFKNSGSTDSDKKTASKQYQEEINLKMQTMESNIYDLFELIREKKKIEKENPNISSKITQEIRDQAKENVKKKYDEKNEKIDEMSDQFNESDSKEKQYSLEEVSGTIDKTDKIKENYNKKIESSTLTDEVNDSIS